MKIFNKLHYKRGSIIQYKEKLYRICKISDDKNMVYVDLEGKYLWNEDKAIIAYCILIPVSDFKVINR